MILHAAAASTPRVRPFPWNSLAGVSRRDVAAVSLFRDWFTAHFDARRLLEAATELVGEPVSIDGVSFGPAPVGGEKLRPDVAVAVRTRASGGLGDALILQAPRELASRMLSRTLRRPLALSHDPSVVPSEAFAGAFAAMVVAIARRSGATRSPEATAQGPAQMLLQGQSANAAHVGDDVLSCELTVRLTGEPFAVRLTAARATLVNLERTMRPTHWEELMWRNLSVMRLAMPVCVCSSTAPARDVASLAVGDAWMPGTFALERSPPGPWTGPVSLVAPRSSHGIAADLMVNGCLKIGRGATSRPFRSVEIEEGNMRETNQTGSLLDAIGDLPVNVRVELGTVELRACDWAAVAAGDVLTFDKRVGAPVALRAGGAIVAYGELVEVEGEIGVRIVQRVGALK